MNQNYFVLSPGRCGSILTSYVIMHSLNSYYKREDYCQMQHVNAEYTKSKFDTPSTVYHCHSLEFNHVKRDDCDLIFVLRKNMIDACLSMYLADTIFKMYTIDSTVHQGNQEKFDQILAQIPSKSIIVDPKNWIRYVKQFNSFSTYNLGKISSLFKNVYSIYYEDFKDNYKCINTTLNIPIENIPDLVLTKKLPYDKWDLIKNKQEIIDLFQQQV